MIFSSASLRRAATPHRARTALGGHFCASMKWALAKEGKSETSWPGFRGAARRPLMKTEKKAGPWVGSSEPQALFIMIFESFLVWLLGLRAPRKRKGQPQQLSKKLAVAHIIFLLKLTVDANLPDGEIGRESTLFFATVSFLYRVYGAITRRRWRPDYARAAGGRRALGVPVAGSP